MTGAAQAAPPVLHRATIAAPDDFEGWRATARSLLTARIGPQSIVWEVAGDAAPDLFGAIGEAGRLAAVEPPLHVPRDLMALLRHALMHSAPTRFALAYRILWRLRTQPQLHADPADPDLIAARLLAKAVRRDIHKMHAFVRFRRVGAADGREQFAAWFEPDHHITRAVAGFFRDRFTGMDWLIVTPQASISWDGQTLREGPGGTRTDVPGADAIEDEWCAYYRSIFNPARLKIDAMKREMPVRYWRNLPEAALISSLSKEAGKRVTVMVEQTKDAQFADEPQLFGGADGEPGDTPRFESLDQLYAALRRDDEAPAPDFAPTIVPGEGPLHAPLFFVGEQPGDQEDLAGRPFVGPAGQLLDDCLAEAGIARERMFFTNAVKRFKFAPRGKRRLHQTPTAGDIAHYRWWLAQEIALVDPPLIVALGSTALQALSGRKQPLGPVRGTVRPWQERAMLVTVHPSFLLRLPDAQARQIERDKFIRDLRAAAAAVPAKGRSARAD